jgi:hypothetical protein
MRAKCASDIILLELIIVIITITGFSDFVHRPDSKINRRKHLRTETDQVSETSCFSSIYIRIRTMYKVRKPSNSVLYAIVRTL